jgi:hypothetical protein
VAVVSKILFPADKNAACRGERLRKRLALGDIPEIASRSVRNAYEHIDEKIDALRVPDADSQIWLMDTNEEACGDPIVLKRFDPVSRTIQFLGNRLDLEACKEEIVLVERSL